MQALSRRVTAAVVNYRTPDLLTKAVESFRIHYSHVPLIIVDNGSDQETVRVVENLADRFENVRVLCLPENIFHGPAMHTAIASSDSPFVFVFDSDTETMRGGFLEQMLEAFDHEDVYAVGQTVKVNKRGFASRSGKITVPASAYMLVDRLKYSKLPPFIHHGLPVLNNMTAANRRGWEVRDFPVAEYINHEGRGTASKFGYGLGFRSRLDYLLNRFGL